MKRRIIALSITLALLLSIVSGFAAPDPFETTKSGRLSVSDGSPVMAVEKTAPKKIKITGSKYVAKGKKITLKATVTPADANQKVIWSSSDEKIATVTKKGVVKGVKAGTVTITATSSADSKVQKTWKIKVMEKAASKVTISNAVETLDLAGTKSVKLKSYIEPAKAAQSVEWTSSDPSVATVSTKGTVKAISVGTVKITATATDGSKKKASVTIRVIDSSKIPETPTPTPIPDPTPTPTSEPTPTPTPAPDPTPTASEQPTEKPTETTTDSPIIGGPIKCTFTIPEEKPQIGKPYTVTYELTGGSGKYINLTADVSYYSENGNVGYPLNGYDVIEGLAAPSGEFTFTPRVGSGMVIYLSGADEETEEHFQLEVNNILPNLIEENAQYPVTFEYDKEQYSVNETITVEYSIEGLSEIKNAKIWWSIFSSNSWKVYQNEKNISTASGTHTFDPPFGGTAYAVLEGEDSNGNPIYAEGSRIQIISQYDPITCTFTIPEEKPQIGKPYTVSYELTGGSGKYINLTADVSYYSENGNVGYPLNGYDVIEGLPAPSGEFTFTPRVGSGMVIYLSGADEETEEHFQLEVNNILPNLIEENAQYPVTFEYDKDQYSVNETITVEYSIEGLSEIKNAKIWWSIFSSNSWKVYQNEKSISTASGTHTFDPPFAGTVYAVIEGEDSNGNPIYAEGKRVKVTTNN